MIYDYLIVGAGLYGSMMAYRLTKAGYSVLVVDRRATTGGNLHCENIDGIDVHCYGAHIFHTSNKKVWDFVNSITPFAPFINSPKAYYKGRYYNLPFNLNTFRQLWGEEITAEQAKQIIAKQRAESGIVEPKNLEEQAIYLVGADIYNTLIKGYTEKQWGRKCNELPADIIRRLPVRYTADNNYFNDTYQGIPIGGYNRLIDSLLYGADIRVNCDYIFCKTELEKISRHTIYTGEIDRYFNFCYGKLEWRSLDFEIQKIDKPDFQSNAVINYTDVDLPYTRIIEHKHFSGVQTPTTIITKEYPKQWQEGQQPYYPINSKANNDLYLKYQKLANAEPRTTFGGRLAMYRYLDMHQIVEQVLDMKIEPRE